jgi:hypothetical protein
MEIGNFDREMVGKIVLEFTHIKLNVRKIKNLQFFKSLIKSTPSIIRWKVRDFFCQIFFIAILENNQNLQELHLIV